MSNSTEEFIDAFVYSMYGKCQIQMVQYARFAVFRARCVFVSWSFDLIEGHWECEKHATMLGCLCKALSERRMRHICKMEKLEIKYFCKKEISPKESHTTSWKPLGRRVLLIRQ